MNVAVRWLDCQIRLFLLQYAFKKKMFSKQKVEHWLDHSKEKYSPQLVEDTKCLLRLLVLFIPFPIFNSLLWQQVSKFGIKEFHEM